MALPDSVILDVTGITGDYDYCNGTFELVYVGSWRYWGAFDGIGRFWLGVSPSESTYLTITSGFVQHFLSDGGYFVEGVILNNQNSEGGQAAIISEAMFFPVINLTPGNLANNISVNLPQLRWKKG